MNCKRPSVDNGYMTYAEIAKAEGITESQVCHILNRAIKKVRLYVVNNNLVDLFKDSHDFVVPQDYMKEIVETYKYVFM